MTDFVFKELSSLYEIRRTYALFLRKVYFNFTTTTTTEFMLIHILIEFVNCMIVRSCSNIEHHAKIWLQIFAQPLIEPFVRINFAIISLFNSKDKVDSSRLQNIVCQSKIPSLDLEHVNNIHKWFNTRVHNISHIFHLKFPISIFCHKSFLLKYFQVKKILICCIFFKRLRDIIKAITD